MEDIDIWLTRNNLSEEVCDKLKDREVTIDELLELTDDELRSFCDDMEFTSVQKVRLLKAVKSYNPHKLQDHAEEKNSNNDKTNLITTNDNQDRKTVFVTQQENDQYQLLNAQTDQTEKLMKQINDGYKNLDTECDKTIKQINEYFDKLLIKLKSKQSELTNNIDDIQKYKYLSFQQQLSSSNKYLEYISKV